MAGESLNDKQSAAYTVNADQEMPSGALRVTGTVATMGGSSGGGGAVTIADGADVTEGSTADAAVITDSSGTVSAKLRGLIKIWADVWDPINHWVKISVSSSSIIQPVSLTSGFPVIQPVSITSGFPVTQPVSITSGFPVIQPVSVTSGFPVIQPVSVTSGFPVVQPISITSGVPIVANQGTIYAVNVTQFATGTVVTGVGASTSGVPRVALSNDSLVRISDGTTTAAVITSIQSLKTDQSSIAGTVTETARAGVMRVGMLGATGVALDAVLGGTLPLNAMLTGGRVATSNPNASTNALLVSPMMDKLGRQVVTEGHVRDMVGVQQTFVQASAETTILTQGGNGVFNDITSIVMSTTGTTVNTITIKDSTAGTTRMILKYPNGAGKPVEMYQLQFVPPLPQAASNNNWTVTHSSSTVGMNYTVQFLKNL